MQRTFAGETLAVEPTQARRTKGPLRKTICFALWMVLATTAFGAAVKRSHCARHPEKHCDSRR